MSTGMSIPQNIKDKGTNIADKAANVAGHVADKAKDVAENVKDKAKDVAGAVGEKADSAAATVGGGLKTAADTIREHAPDKGVIGDASKSVAGALESGGRFLEEKGLTGIGEGVTDLIKQHPVPAVLLALGVGYLIACSTRS